MKFTFFHLMPFTDFPDTAVDWPVGNETFDAERAREMYDSYIDDMAYAEECDFDWIGCNEHHFSPYSLMANCNLIGAALVHRTSKARLAMLGNLLPLLNPIRVAEEYAMLDVMSGGRLIAGFIRGIPHEYVAYNAAPDDSRARLQEAIELILKAWTEPEPFGWESEHYQYRAVSIWPRPYQKPHPPILLSGSNQDSAEFAARNHAMMGIVLIADLGLARRTVETYRESASAHGWTPGPEHIMVGQHCCIAETDAEALDAMREPVRYFHQVLLGGPRTAQKIVVQKTRFFADEKVGEGFAKRLATLHERSLEEMIEAGSLLCGSPETVVKQIRRLKDELGHGMFNLTMKVGNIPDAVVRRGMELFRDRVLPEVRDL